MLPCRLAQSQIGAYMPFWSLCGFFFFFTSLGSSGRAGDADSFTTGRRRDNLSDTAHTEAEGYSANTNPEYGWHFQFLAHCSAAQCRQLQQIGWWISFPLLKIICIDYGMMLN